MHGWGGGVGVRVCCPGNTLGLAPLQSAYRRDPLRLVAVLKAILEGEKAAVLKRVRGPCPTAGAPRGAGLALDPTHPPLLCPRTITCPSASTGARRSSSLAWGCSGCSTASARSRRCGTAPQVRGWGRMGPALLGSAVGRSAGGMPPLRCWAVQCRCRLLVLMGPPPFFLRSLSAAECAGPTAEA